VESTLLMLDLLHYWRGEHILQVTPKILAELGKLYPDKPRILDSNLLVWNPPARESPDKKKSRSKGKFK
jgi:hypothetical protein